MKPPIKFRWRGIHHGYLGAWFVNFGLFFLYMNINNGLDELNVIYQFFIVIGVYLIIDDCVEHTITRSTPMRILWEFLVKRI